MHSTQSIGQYYDDLAPQYDVLTADGAWTPNTLVGKELELLTCDQPRLLDLGTGTGQTLDAIQQALTPQQVIAVDVSPRMCAIASRRHPDVSIRLDSIQNFLKHNTTLFDMVTAIGALEFIPDLPRLLVDVCHQVRRGGQCLFTYEPLVGGLGVQSERKSTTRSTGESQAMLTTYRWKPQEIHSALAALATIERNSLFVSYRRGSEPVIYNLIRAINQ